MKFTVGSGSGVVLPRIYNPFIFAGVTIAMAIGVLGMLCALVLCAVMIPFSLFLKVRMIK